MTLNKNIIELIKQKSGLLFDKAGDFELLSFFVFKETKRTIGSTTLKRLFDYINDDHKTSDYTLNTIAIYLGFPSWQQLRDEVKIDSEWGFKDDTIYINDLSLNTEIEIKYLNRIVVFKVIQFENTNAVQVISAQNSSLNNGDILLLHSIKEGSLLEAEKVYRGDSVGNYRTNGEITSIIIKKMD